MPGKCPQCGSRIYLARTTIKSELIEIQNIPCTACQEFGDEHIVKLVQKKIDKILEHAAKGKLKTRMVVMSVQTLTVEPYSSSDHQPLQNCSFSTFVNLPKWHYVSALPNSHTIPPHSTAI